VGSSPYQVIGFFQLHYGPGVDSASNRNEFQKYFLGGGGKGLPARKADDLTVICEPTV
jgi:hypothetical protein